MAGLPPGVQVVFDEDEHATETSASGDRVYTPPNKDYHREMYPSYVPPQLRGHRTDADKFVNFKFDNDRNGNPNPDKIQGVDNLKYQRLHIRIPFAMPKDDMAFLIKQHPGVYFHCSDNHNHDHPVSHANTIVGTRFMQRKMFSGSRILDVYGNPNACDGFNKGQVTADNPKSMKALVSKRSPTDFIREINKWGAALWDDETERYHTGSLMSMVRSGDIEEYDVLQLTHTLYYVPFNELAEALHAPTTSGRKRTAYALVHRHQHQSGSLNKGELTYVKKKGLVKQVSVLTKSAYVHPDITPMLFSENKVWMPAETDMTRDTAEGKSTCGLTWDLQKVTDETWIVQFAPYVETPIEDGIDYNAMWDEDEDIESMDPLTSQVEPTGMHPVDQSLVVPSKSDGEFFVLKWTNHKLFNKLRQTIGGKPRGKKQFEDLLGTAKHLNDPAALFGEGQGMQCAPDELTDTVVAAFLYDVVHEKSAFDAIQAVQATIEDHARAANLATKFGGLRFGDLLQLFRAAIWGVRQVNKVARATDPLEHGLAMVDDALI